MIKLRLNYMYSEEIAEVFVIIITIIRHGFLGYLLR